MSLRVAHLTSDTSHLYADAAALKTNSRGDLPIHRACMNRGPDRDSIVKALLDLEPGIRAHHLYHKSPLRVPLKQIASRKQEHRGIYHSTGITATLVQPTHSILHRACFCSTLGSVKQLIGRHPDALRKPDAKGQVPLFKC